MRLYQQPDHSSLKVGSSLAHPFAPSPTCTFDQYDGRWCLSRAGQAVRDGVSTKVWRQGGADLGSVWEAGLGFILDTRRAKIAGRQI